MQIPPPLSQGIRLKIPDSDPNFLAGLEEWHHLGLLTESQIRELSAKFLSCSIHITLQPPLNHPELLDGIETWVRLGLVSPDDVLSFSGHYLSQTLPSTVAVPPPLRGTISKTVQPFNPAKSEQKGRISQLFQSFMDEFSVLWLLFLGVFLVVVSSAVLAASQWQAVSPVGQYGILFAYTLAFWIVSYWVGRKENLQLTANTLQLTSLLIIPVNFWMIDAFKLLEQGVGVGVAIAAGIILSGLTYLILKPRDPKRWPPLNGGPTWAGGVCFANVLLLSWLQLGWNLPGTGIIAVYIGVIATSLGYLYQQRSHSSNPPKNQSSQAKHLGMLFVWAPLYGSLLLLFRATVIHQIPIESMGLAFAIAGWIFCWAARRPILFQSGWLLFGSLLLLFGWIITLETPSSLQTCAITLLALGIVGDRLVRRWHPADLWLLFGIGLQGLLPFYRLIPNQTRQLIINRVVEIVGSQWMPLAGISLLGLPYIWLTLWGSHWLTLKSQPKLARLGKQLPLGLGIVLAILTLGNPIIRTIYLGLGLATLIQQIQGVQKTPAPLIQLTHGVGLATGASLIHTIEPTLSAKAWAGLCFGCMLTEWALSTRLKHPLWKKSTWIFGSAFAGVGYICLWHLRPFYDFSLPSTTSSIESYWGLMAWSIPLGLILIAERSLPVPKRSVYGLAVAAIPLTQLLCLQAFSVRLFGFGLGCLMMSWVAKQLCSFIPVVMSLGFGLLFAGTVLGKWGLIQHPEWTLVALAIASLLFLGVYSRIQTSDSPLKRLYSRALIGWSFCLDIGSILSLTGVSLFFLENSYVIPDALIWGGSLTALTTLFRIWLIPDVTHVVSFLLIIESLVLAIATKTVQPIDTIAIGTLLVSAATWVVGMFPSRIRQAAPPAFWNIVPLFAAIAGVLIGHHDFQKYTGLYTFAAAIIALGIGRRVEHYRPCTYVGLAGLSFGMYELLIYQLMQLEGDYPGDALIIFGAITTAVAVGDRLLSRWSQRLLNLSNHQFVPVAHLHWLCGLIFLMTSLLLPLSIGGKIAWIGLMAILAIYAIWTGRSEAPFIYWGVAEILAIIAFGLDQIWPTAQLLHWGGAIASILALCIYLVPWHQWGWEQRPWQRSASIIPAGVVLISVANVGLSSLLISGAWYAWVSQKSKIIRLSYLGIGLSNWAMFKLINRTIGLTPLWLAVLFGISIMFITQVEPLLQGNHKRELRHWLRCFALGLLGIMALYESDPFFAGSLIMLAGSLLIGFTGIIFKVRACLYMGTLAFMVKIVRLLWIFVASESFLLWALGIILGLTLIWLAATFESRRTQAIAFFDYCSSTLQGWQ